jgi:Pvc16 N-terminal domain
MADYAAIAAALKSIERLLNAAFLEEQPVSGKKTHAVLARTSDFTDALLPVNVGSPALSIYLYRVDFNKTMRASWSAVGSLDGIGHLALDLHLILTAWADNAEFEYRIIGKALQCLESTPILAGPLLDPSSNWAPNESVQIVLEDISTEAIMRTFDSLPTDYRLSIPYILRVVRVDSRVPAPPQFVTTIVTGKIPEPVL